jgi:type II secretory pathway component PulC
MASIALTASALLSACARNSNEPNASAPAAQSSGSQSVASNTSATPSESPRSARTGLTRALVEETVAQGLGVFLSRVTVAPVVEGRRFIGFRLEAAEDLEAWNAAGADLRVGDVIQRINGQPIERPEQAMWAFDQLRIAQGVEVVGIRGAAPFRVYSAISDAR